ncbi:hypothetical protein ACFL4L_04190 [bacterium]
MRTKYLMITVVLLIVLTGTIDLKAQNPDHYVTFTVPIRLYNLHPDVRQVQIHAGCIWRVMMAYRAKGVVTLDVPSDGNLVQDVEIVATEYENQDITNADYYRIWFMLVTDDHPNGESPDSEATDSALKPKEGEELVTVVDGQLNW